MKSRYNVSFLKEKPTSLFFEVNQTHSNIIVSLNEVKKSKSLISADGISWRDEDFNLQDGIAIKTADCLSIFIQGECQYYLLHAGWRGLKNKILSNIHAPLSATIFPSIKKCCFEVSPDFYKNFQNSLNFSLKNGKIYFDMVSEARQQLEKISPNIKFSIDANCTFCSKKNFHSFRRDKTDLRNYTLVTN